MDPKRYKKARAVLEEEYQVFLIGKTEDPENLANNILRQAHHDRVDGLANDIVSEINDGRILTAEALWDYLSEAIDGSIYSDSDALDILKYSNNDQAHADEYGEAHATWGAMAYSALRADVCDELRSCGVDTNDPAPHTIKCPKCGELPVEDEDTNECPKCHWFRREERCGYDLKPEGQCGEGELVCRFCLTSEEKSAMKGETVIDDLAIEEIEADWEYTCARCHETFKAF